MLGLITAKTILEGDTDEAKRSTHAFRLILTRVRLCQRQNHRYPMFSMQNTGTKVNFDDFDYAKIINTAKVERPMSNDSENGTNGMFGILTSHPRPLQTGIFGLSVRFDACSTYWAKFTQLTEFHGEVCLPFEYTNVTFGDKDTASAFVLGDAVFIAGLGLVVLGSLDP